MPLICVGETLAEREAGRADDVLTAQVAGRAARPRRTMQLSAEILFAYEPVWAIGDKGIPASADYADKQQALIKQRRREPVAGTPRLCSTAAASIPATRPN